MIVIHRPTRNSHCVSKGVNRFVSVSPEPEEEYELNGEHEKAKVDPEPLDALVKISKSVQFAEFEESYECDTSPEDVFSTWYTVSYLID